MEHSRGTGMKNTPVTPTLQSLIKQKIIEKGLLRPDLVHAIGYSNISKGCQRLDTFLKTLESPSEYFIVSITSTLGIDAVTFYRALTASMDQFSADAKRTFKPHIEILLGISDKLSQRSRKCSIESYCIYS
jgi:hypothetical protein